VRRIGAEPGAIFQHHLEATRVAEEKLLWWTVD